MEELNKIYKNLNNPACYAGGNQLYEEGKKSYQLLTKKIVNNFLEKNRTYSINKQRRVNFQRVKTIPAGFMTDIQTDLGDFQQISKFNKGYKYLLVCVDVLSRRIFLEPLKSKTNQEVQNKFELIFNKMPIIPHRIYSDNGLEFQSKKMLDFFKSFGIEKYSSNDDNIKAALAERLIRTIKTRIYRYFSEKNTKNWIFVINKFENAINNSICRITNMKPNDVNFKNAQKLWKKLYGNLNVHNTKVSKLKIGDNVRIAKKKSIFQKGYLPNFTDEIFTIYKIKKTLPYLYYLRDNEEENIEGAFYAPELCKVTVDKETSFRIEKIFKQRTRNNIKKYYVKFIGYPKKYWVQENDFV